MYAVSGCIFDPESIMKIDKKLNRLDRLMQVLAKYPGAEMWTLCHELDKHPRRRFLLIDGDWNTNPEGAWVFDTLQECSYFVENEDGSCTGDGMNYHVMDLMTGDTYYCAVAHPDARFEIELMNCLIV